MSTIFPKIVILGDSGVGKTDFVWTAIDSQPNVPYNRVDAGSTIGMDMKSSTRLVNADTGDTLRVMLYDTAGQERFASLTRLYYRDATAIVFMYAVNHLETLSGVTTNWFPIVKEQFDGRTMPVLFLVGTKTDLRREVTVEGGRAAAQRIGAEFFEMNTRDENGALARATLDKIARSMVERGVLPDAARRLKEEQSRSISYRMTQRKNKIQCCK
jgi:small GTP-binding protein